MAQYIIKVHESSSLVDDSIELSPHDVYNVMIDGVHD